MKYRESLIVFTVTGVKVGEESRIALTAEGASVVNTLWVHCTVMYTHGTFINIYKQTWKTNY